MDYNSKGLTQQERCWWFDHANGNDKVYIEGYYYFANGARRDNFLYCLPPTNEVERNRLIAKFWEEKTRLAKRAFDELKQQMRHEIEATNTSDDSSFEKLKALQEDYEKCGAKLEEMRATFPENDPEVIRKKQEIEQHSAATKAHYMSKLDAFKI